MAGEEQIGVTTSYWTDPSGGKWKIRFHWWRVGREVRSTRVDIESFDARRRRQVDHALLETLPLDLLRTEGLEEARKVWELAAVLPITSEIKAAKRQAPSLSVASRSVRQEARRLLEAHGFEVPEVRRGRPRVSDETLREVAAIVRAAKSEGRPTYQAVVDRLPSRPSLRHAGNLIREARKRGILDEEEDA